MFRAINEYLAKLNIVTDDELLKEMNDYLEKQKTIDHFSINVNYNRYIVDIRLKKYTVKSADSLFRKFVQHTAYPYSHITRLYGCHYFPGIKERQNERKPSFNTGRC